MGFTTEQLTELEARIASAERSVSEGDITVVNQNLTDMIRLRDKMKSEIDAASTTAPRQRRTFRMYQSGRGQ